MLTSSKSYGIITRLSLGVLLGNCSEICTRRKKNFNILHLWACRLCLQSYLPSFLECASSDLEHIQEALKRTIYCSSLHPPPMYAHASVISHFLYVMRMLNFCVHTGVNNSKITSVHSFWTKYKSNIYVSFHSTPTCLLYTSPSPRDLSTSRMPSSA